MQSQGMGVRWQIFGMGKPFSGLDKNPFYSNIQIILDIRYLNDPFYTNIQIM